MTYRVRIKVGYDFYIGKDKRNEPTIVTHKHAAEFATYEDAQAFRQQFIDSEEDGKEYRARKTEVTL